MQSGDISAVLCHSSHSTIYLFLRIKQGSETEQLDQPADKLLPQPSCPSPSSILCTLLPVSARNSSLSSPRANTNPNSIHRLYHHF